MGLGVEVARGFCGELDRVEVATGDGRRGLGGKDEEVVLVITDGVEDDDASVVAGVGVRSGEMELSGNGAGGSAGVSEVAIGVGVRSGVVELAGSTEAGGGVKIELVITEGEDEDAGVFGVG